MDFKFSSANTLYRQVERLLSQQKELVHNWSHIFLWLGETEFILNESSPHLFLLAAQRTVYEGNHISQEEDVHY